MIWLWISTIVVLLGAELNAEIEHQTARDSTVGADKPLSSVKFSIFRPIQGRPLFSEPPGIQTARAPAI